MIRYFSKEVVDKRIYPDPVLRQQAIPLEAIDAKDREMIDDMARRMYLYKGIGLAAPQIGILLRVVVVNSGYGLIPLINPEIVESEGNTMGEEGCLSLPDVTVSITRNARILVRGRDVNEKDVEFEASGLLARVFLHEIDHLDGKLIIDKHNAETKEGKLYQQGSDKFLAKLRVADVTFYVEYSLAGDGAYTVHTAYSHRTELGGE
ncbi:MAG: peptide deformylase [Thermodesulfobacteriota bacterium]